MNMPYIQYPDPYEKIKFYGVIILVALALLIVFIGKGCAEEVDLSIIAQIESNNNPMAYNKVSGAIGLYQITPVCLEDYNRHISPKIPLNALYNPVEAYKVAKWYLYIRIPQMLTFYHIPVSIDNILWAYNAGIGNVVRGIKPAETKRYIRRYHQLSKQ